MEAALQLLVVALATVFFGWGVFRAVRNGFRGRHLVASLAGLLVLSVLTLPMLLLTYKEAMFALTSGHAYEISEVRNVIIFGILVGLLWLLGLGANAASQSMSTVLRGSHLSSSAQLMQVMYGKKPNRYSPSLASLTSARSPCRRR